MTFRPVTEFESRFRYYDKLFSKKASWPTAGAAAGALIIEPSVYLCCSDSKDDRAYTKEIYSCLKSRSVDVFFDDEDDVEFSGEIDEEVKTTALLRCSHGLLVVTSSLLRRDAENVGPLKIANAMLARLPKTRIWPLLVDVDIRDFQEAFPRYASLRPVQFGRKVAEVVSEILKQLTKDSKKWAEAARVPNHANDLLMDRLPPKLVGLKGRKHELKKILDEFSPGSPYCWISGLPGIGKSSLAIHVAHEVRKRRYNVIYIGAQTLESEMDIFSEILRSLKQYVSAKDHAQTAEFTDPVVSEVIHLIKQIEFLCIVLDGCDQALASNNSKQQHEAFLTFLWKIRGPMILITSCFKAQHLPVNVIDIPLSPLENDDAENLLKSCLPFEHQSLLKRSTIVRVQQLCQGVPILIRLAGSMLCKFREALTQDEIVQKLQANPLQMLKTVNSSATAFIAAIYDLVPSSLKLSLHGVALFIGSFTRLEGAHVFGFKEGLQFGIEVVGPLQEYSLLVRSSNDEVTDDNTQYYVHGLIREFLRQRPFKTSEFQEIQEKYCIMQLDKIAEVQSMYDANPRDAILKCRMHGFSKLLGELAGTLRKLCETSSKVWGRLLSIARHPNSWMNHCFDKETQKKFLQVCLEVALEKNLTVVEMNIRLLLSDVLLQLNERKAAASGFERVQEKLTPIHVTKEQKGKLDARYCLMKAKFYIAENEGQKAVDSLMKEFERFSWATEQQDFYVTLGNAHKCCRNYHKAIISYKIALERCEAKFLKSHFHPEIFYLLMNLGQCQFCSSRFPDSYRNFSRALEMQRYLRYSQLRLATTFYHLGICQASIGKQSEALDQFKEVYDILEDRRRRDTKDDQSAVYLLTRQAHAKVLYTKGIELWRTLKGEDIIFLRDAASYLQHLLKRLQDYSEMRLILAESHALLVIIYCLLSDEKRALNHQHRLGQIYLDQELVDRCSVLSYIKKTDTSDDSMLFGVQSAALNRRLSVTFHCYVGGQLIVGSGGAYRRKRTSSGARNILESSIEEQRSQPQLPPMSDYWDEFDICPSTASTELSTTGNITSGEPTHPGGSAESRVDCLPPLIRKSSLRDDYYCDDVSPASTEQGSTGIISSDELTFSGKMDSHVPPVSQSLSTLQSQDNNLGGVGLGRVLREE